MTERRSIHSINGQIGALERWGRTPRAERRRQALPGRDGLLARFAAEADPDGSLPEAERLEAAEQLRRAHMQRLAKLSAQARARSTT